MTAVFADTFFYLALLGEDDEAHERAKAILTKLDRSTITTAWVVTEVADGLAKRRNRPRFIGFLDTLRKNPRTAIIPPSQALFDKAIALFSARPDRDWSLTDCTSFVIMQEMNLTDALTGDHHFEQAGFRALLR